MKKNSKIYIAGHTGLVGSAILKNLELMGYSNLIFRTHEELDLEHINAVERFFEEENPEYVFLAAAKVGGIVANNTYRADFIYENLMIQNNVIHQAYKTGVQKLMFLGSTCIYPENCPQPIKEEYLLTGPLEYTNEPYAIAKIAGIKMCESYNLQYGTNFISVMPTNLYGPHDNYDLETSHVLPALIRKFHLGKALEENNWDLIKNDLNKSPIKGISGDSGENEILGVLARLGVISTSGPDKKIQVLVEIWGSGKPLREFLWSEDMAEACIYIMEKVDFNDLKDNYESDEIRNTHLNIGTEEEISIKDLAYLIKEIVSFKGELYFNSSKPEGTLRKVTDCSKIHALGWKNKINIREGIKKMYSELKGFDHSLGGLKKNKIPVDSIRPKNWSK